MPHGSVVPLPPTADVAIVGGGYTGLAAALELARTGRHVLVLERDAVAAGASSRNGGMAHPGAKLSLPQLLALPGGRQLWNETVAAFEGIGELCAELGIDCDWSRSGHLELAHHSRPGSHLRAVAAAHIAVGDRASVLEADDLSNEIGSTCFKAGLLVERSGAVHPAKLAAGLARGALSAGAEIHDVTDVLGVENGRPGHVVRTSKGSVRCAEVVVATNGTTEGRLVPWLGRRVLGLSSYMIATEPLDADLAACVNPRGRMFFDTRNLLHYWRLSPDGKRVLFGGRTSLSPTSVEQARDRLYRAMVQIHPQLAGTCVARAWGGRVGITADLIPHVGRHGATGIVYAMGYGGSGVAMATHTGRVVGRWVAGLSGPPAFAGPRWPRVPLVARAPWLLPVAGWLLRARDTFGW